MDFSRNLGLISAEQQKLLQKASVLVAGCGGMGGVCAEVLVRMGIGKITLVDPDRFEKSNANRQLHCHRGTIGQFKTRVLKKEFLKINPKLKIRSFEEAVELRNVKKILKGTNIVVNGMDQMLASICLEREARRQGLPIVDAWLTPFASVFTLQPTDPHWEEFLQLPTRDKAETEITEKDCQQALEKELQYTFNHFDPYKHIDPAHVKRVLNGEAKRPSLAPVVWLSGVLMANEVFKLILGMPSIGPEGIFYDQYEHRLIPGKGSAAKKKGQP